MKTLTRRSFLKMSGLTAAGLAVAQTGGIGRLLTPMAAAAAQAGADQSFDYTLAAVYTLPVGDITVTVIQEGYGVLNAGLFGANAGENQAADLLAQNNLPSPNIKSGFNVVLARFGSRMALLDTGLGDYGFPGIASVSGRLPATLAALGIQPEAVTDVVISHFHPDHIGAAASADGTLTFPNAVYRLPETEWAFLQNTSGTPFDDLIEGAKTRLQGAVSLGQFQTYASEDEVLPGIHSMATPGHTPGHVSYRLTSGSEQLILAVDTAVNYLLSLRHPDWYMGFDALPDQAVETRKMLFGMIADDQLRVLGYHFPFPGIGYVERNGDGFEFLPTGF